MLKIGLEYIIFLQMVKNALKKCYCDVTSGYRRYSIFSQFVRNALLRKVRLNEGKVFFR